MNLYLSNLIHSTKLDHESSIFQVSWPHKKGTWFHMTHIALELKQEILLMVPKCIQPPGIFVTP